MYLLLVFVPSLLIQVTDYLCWIWRFYVRTACANLSAEFSNFIRATREHCMPYVYYSVADCGDFALA